MFMKFNIYYITGKEASGSAEKTSPGSASLLCSQPLQTTGEKILNSVLLLISCKFYISNDNLNTSCGNHFGLIT